MSARRHGQAQYQYRTGKKQWLGLTAGWGSRQKTAYMNVGQIQWGIHYHCHHEAQQVSLATGSLSEVRLVTSAD